jgi:hypothetical protein
MGSGAVQVIRVQLAALLLLWCGFTGQGAGQVPTDRYRNVIGWQSRPGEGALNAPSGDVVRISETQTNATMIPIRAQLVLTLSAAIAPSLPAAALSWHGLRLVFSRILIGKCGGRLKHSSAASALPFAC